MEKEGGVLPMQEEKQSFVFYTQWGQALQMLPPEDAVAH